MPENPVEPAKPAAPEVRRPTMLDLDRWEKARDLERAIGQLSKHPEAEELAAKEAQEIATGIISGTEVPSLDPAEDLRRAQVFLSALDKMEDGWRYPKVKGHVQNRLSAAQAKLEPAQKA